METLVYICNQMASDGKVIAQNNYTNQCLHVIGKQLDRMEEKVKNKVILQPGSPSKPSPALEKPLVMLLTTRQDSLKSEDQTALEVCLQKMEELVKKEPVTPSPNTTSSSRLVTLKAYTASSSSSRTSSESEKKEGPLKKGLQGLKPQTTPPKIWISKYRGKESFETFHRKRVASKYYRFQKLKNAKGIYKIKQPPTPKASGKCFKCRKRGHLRIKCEGKDRALASTNVSTPVPGVPEPKVGPKVKRKVNVHDL